MEKLCQEIAFEVRAYKPEQREANGIADRLIPVLFKILHGPIIDGKYPQIEVRRHLMSHRNTPHPSTGKAPSELMMRRLLTTNVVTPIILSKGNYTKKQCYRTKRVETKANNLEAGTKKAAHRNTKVGEKVLIKLQKTITKPAFDPKA